jgi:UPF0755 protein
VARPTDERTPEERAAAAAERAARRGEDAPPPETFGGRGRAARAQTPDVTAEFEWDGFEDPPAEAPRRVSTMAARAPQRPRRAPARRQPPPRRPAGRGSHIRRRLAALLAVLLFAGAVYLLWSTFQPLHGDGSGAVSVTIPAGANAGRIGDLLAEKGVVDNGTFFELNATITNRRGKLRPGNYRLMRGMSYGDAIAALVEGPKAKVVKTIDINVPEGLSIREAAPKVDQGPLQGSYLKAARSARTLRKIHQLGAPKRVKTAEGFLFPATYTLVDGAPARNLVDRQLAAFEDNLSKVDMSYAKKKNLTRYDVLIIASMVEREAQLDAERPLVAAVIYNRLKQGMPLGIDATIRYYENNWARPLRVSELERQSPYNTRLNRGLPPTPIGSPGLASLKAAANPARKDYLFYVRKPGKSGEHAFSSTDAQFERDVAKYQASRNP